MIWVTSSKQCIKNRVSTVWLTFLDETPVILIVEADCTKATSQVTPKPTDSEHLWESYPQKHKSSLMYLVCNLGNHSVVTDHICHAHPLASSKNKVRMPTRKTIAPRQPERKPRTPGEGPHWQDHKKFQKFEDTSLKILQVYFIRTFHNL